MIQRNRNTIGTEYWTPEMKQSQILRGKPRELDRSRISVDNEGIVLGRRRRSNSVEMT